MKPFLYPTAYVPMDSHRYITNSMASQIPGAESHLFSWSVTPTQSAQMVANTNASTTAKPTPQPSPSTWATPNATRSLYTQPAATPTSLVSNDNSFQLSTPATMSQSAKGQFVDETSEPKTKPPRKRRAKRMTISCLTTLIQTCVQYKASCNSQKGHKRFWISVADHFLQATGRTEFNWQTAQKRVLTLTEEHRAWLRAMKPDEEYSGDQGLKNALDEWTAHLDGVKAREEAFYQDPESLQQDDDVIQTHCNSRGQTAKWPRKRSISQAADQTNSTSESEMSGSRSEGRQSQTKRRRTEDHPAWGYIADFFKMMTDQIKEEGLLKTKVDNIEQRLTALDQRVDKVLGQLENKDNEA